MLEKWHEFHKIARDAFKVNNLWCFYQTLLVMQFHFDGKIVKLFVSHFTVIVMNVLCTVI